MKNIFLLLLFGVALFLLYASEGSSSDQKLPVVNGEEVLAMVNNDPITMGEFDRALSTAHSEGGKEGLAGKLDYKGILNRLITLRLVRQEAINIGLNDLPETKEMVDQYSRQALTGLLKGLQVKGMEAEEEEVDRLYKEAVMEYKLNSVLFDKKDNAEKIEEELKAGADFNDIVKRTIAHKTAKGKGEGEYIKGQELSPKIMKPLTGMKIGDVSQVIEIVDGYIIFKVEDIRLPENPAAKEMARKQALDYKRKKALEEYKDSLITKYVKVDAKVLESIDYESSVDAFDKLLEDPRIVAEIEGEKPLTVGELTEGLKNKYYHGVEPVIKKKKLNDNKRAFLFETLLPKRVLLKEALKLKIDTSPVYKSMVKEYESAILFDAFVKKVVVPDIKLDNEEVDKYYQKNIDKYSSPERMRINSIAFVKKDAAEDALDKLRKGTDFKWLNANAENQVDKDAKGLETFEGAVVVTSDLDEDVIKAVSGAKSGDVRLYTSPEKYYYVLYIQDVFPSKPLPFEDLKDQLSEEVFKEKLSASIEDWANKLREVYEVKVYATDL